MKVIERETDYKTKRSSLFLGPKIGLIENYRHEFDKIWNRYKILKSLDWSEDEIDISSCNSEFKKVDKEISDLMIKTLAWQWEADSEACHVGRILIPFVNNTELLCYLVENMKNELLHSLSYKFIVEYSFDDVSTVLDEILSIKEANERLHLIDSIFSNAYEISLNYSLGKEYDELYLRKIILETIIALFALERIQFISSFAITFGLAEKGYFIPIAKLVQKICNDELQVHVQVDKDILENEFKIVDNISIFIENVDSFKAIVDEVVTSELKWLDFLFKDKEEIVGLNKNKIKDFVLYNAQEVYDFLNIENTIKEVRKNPLPYMNKWIVIDSYQSSPQEESVANYLLGNFKDDSEEYFKTLSI